MLSLGKFHVALATMMTTGCTLIPLCEVPGHEHKCAVDDGTTETNGGDTESDSSGPETGTESMTSDVPETETETGSCEVAGCPCTAVEDCSPGLECINDECVEVVCGDMMANGDEQCDDGNVVDGDGCDNDCTYTEILSVDAASYHTCVLVEGGRVRCWGLNVVGQLGLGNTEIIGDDELPNTVGDVDLPMPVTQIAAAGDHTCALLENSSIYCWGLNDSGQLGNGNTNDIGDDEDLVGPVEVGADVEQVTVGGFHTCVRTSGYDVRCWGRGSLGRLGYANAATIGDDELPSAVGDVNLGGGPVVSVATGGAHTCVIALAGNVYCWGRNDLGLLGYGNTNNVGDNETPVSVGAASVIPMGLGPFTKATQISGGVVHTCTLFETGDVLCWGDGFFGQLGRGDTQIVGDNELPSTLPPLEFPDDVVLISAGSAHNCVVLADNDAYCWGAGTFGQLGYGNTNNIGDDEPAAAGGPIDLGAPVVQIDAGFFHTCALTESNAVRCWGSNDAGQLGLGHTNKIGDDEFPLDEPPVAIF
jgi:cysteine-rich repeat protein